MIARSRHSWWRSSSRPTLCIEKYITSTSVFACRSVTCITKYWILWTIKKQFWYEMWIISNLIGFVDATFHFQLGHDTTNDGSFIRNGMMMDSVKFLLRKDLLWQLQESLHSGARTLLCSIVSFAWTMMKRWKKSFGKHVLATTNFYQIHWLLKIHFEPTTIFCDFEVSWNVVPCELFVGHPAWSGVLRSVESSFPGGF